VRHCSRRRCAVPVLFTRREPDYVTWPDLLDRPTVALCPAAARRDDERLTEWVRMPCRPRTRLKCDAGSRNERRVRRLEQRIDSYCTREPLRRPLRGSLCSNPLDLHLSYLRIPYCSSVPQDYSAWCERGMIFTRAQLSMQMLWRDGLRALS
jgi:hypothetical protein